MFCTECGSKNEPSAKFCFDCGSPLKKPSSAVKKDPVPETTPHSPVAPKKPIKSWLKITLFAGVPALLIMSMIAVLVFFKPVPTFETAEQFLLGKNDVAKLDLTSTEALNQLERTGDFIYGPCDAKTDLTSSIKSGTDWASNAYAISDDSDNEIYKISSQIISFDTEVEAQDVIDAASDGAVDPACDSPDIDDYYSGGGKLAESYDVDLIGTHLIDTYSNTDTRQVFARRDNVLLILQVRLVKSNGAVTTAESERLIARALNVFAGNR